MRPAVVCAPLRAEWAALRAGGVPARCTGMGPTRSARAAWELAGAPVLVAGVGGGLAPYVRPGDIVVANEVRGGPGVPVPVPSAPLLAAALRRAGLTVHIGPIVSERAMTSGATRPRLAATGALAVDTESAWLAPPGDGGTAFAAVRSVVDTADSPLWSSGTLTPSVGALDALRRSASVLADWSAAVRPREVLLANPRSFCAGVERAVEIVERALHRYGAPVYVRGQVVHNSHVIRDLEERGAVFVTEAGEVPRGRVMVLAAHGVAPSVRAEAAARDLLVVDATCPLVTKVHTEVRRYAGRGDTVLLIGHGDHEEVEGAVGEAPSRVVVVEDARAAATVTVDDPERVAYAMQTTLAVDEAEGIAAVLRERFPAMRGPRRDDICYATTNRQQAVRAVARGCDLLLVVGSGNSSNSLRLVEVAQREGTDAVLVDDAGDVDLRTLAAAARVGVTAGASAPPHLVDELITCLTGLGPVSLHESPAPPEDIHFTLPREVS